MPVKMTDKKEKLNVLFLCTGNSCRSQIAEGWARFLKSDCIEVFSAGVDPHRVNERAIHIMAEVGVDISQQYSKHLDDLSGLDFDYVINSVGVPQEQMNKHWMYIPAFVLFVLITLMQKARVRKNKGLVAN